MHGEFFGSDLFCRCHLVNFPQDHFEQEFVDWQDQFVHGEPEYHWELVGGSEDDDSGVYKQHQLNPDYYVDFEGMKLYSERIRNGYRLFGKYYQGLWD